MTSSMSDGPEGSREEEIKATLHNSIYASGPIVGRIRRRLIRRETFLDDCAYAVAQLAAYWGPKKPRARDDLLSPLMIMKESGANSKSTPLTSFFTIVFAMIFTLICGFVLGAFFFRSALRARILTVVPIDDQTLILTYASPTDWNLTGDFYVHLLFTTGAFVPVQLQLTNEVVALQTSVVRSLQQFDSAVKLKGNHIDDVSLSRDADGRGDDQAEERDRSERGRSEGRDRLEGGASEERPRIDEMVTSPETQGETITSLPRKEHFTDEDSRSDPLGDPFGETLIVAKAKPLADPTTVAGRCIGKLLSSPELNSQLNPVILHGARRIFFRLTVNITAGQDCRETASNKRKLKSRRIAQRAIVDGDEIASVSALNGSCKEKGGLMLSVEIVTLRLSSTAAIWSVNQTTPYVIVPCNVTDS